MVPLKNSMKFFSLGCLWPRCRKKET